MFLDSGMPGIEVLHVFVGDELGSLQKYFTRVSFATARPWVTGLAFSNATGTAGFGTSYNTRVGDVLIVTIIEFGDTIRLWSKIEPNGVSDPTRKGWASGMLMSPMNHHHRHAQY